MRIVGLVVVFLFLVSGVLHACPSPREVFQATLAKDREGAKIFDPEHGAVKDVGGGLCVAVFVSKTLPRFRSVITVDAGLRYAFPGPPVDLKKDRAVAPPELQRPLTEEEKEALAKHSFEVVSYGGNILYAVLSPSCPFCQRMAYFLLENDRLLRETGVTFRVIPAEHASGDAEAFACLLKEKDSFFARFSARSCLKSAKSASDASLVNRVREAMKFARTRLFGMGIPLVFDAQGNLVARGFDPEALRAWLEKHAKTSKKTDEGGAR